MKKRAVLFLLVCFAATFSRAQQPRQQVFTSDIDHFWEAYDSAQTTTDSARQEQIIQHLYVDRGTEGLQDFMRVRSLSAPLWTKLIRRAPKFWQSIRANTLAAASAKGQLEARIQRLRQLYPALREAKMYFAIGCLTTGGTTTDDKVLIGTEIATGTAETDLSDLPAGKSQWLGSVFKNQQLSNIVALNIHEYVHTQQRPNTAATDVLGQSLCEGACDFITALVMQAPLPNNYIRYGEAHEKELKNAFKEQLFTTYYSNWLYNGGEGVPMADLGYFMGYAICKSYYNNAADKSAAVKDIIELNYGDSAVLNQFMARSHYYNEHLNRDVLVKNAEARQPYVRRLRPSINGKTAASTDIKEITIVFSRKMNGHFSIDKAPGGEDSPIAGVKGFSKNKKTFTLLVNLEPGHTYAFTVGKEKFKSADGYPLKPYTVKFTTE